MSASVRIDKFLWAVRLYKTRTKATDACRSGKVKIDGQIVRPSREIAIGNTISLRKGPVTYSYKIIEVLANRVGAKLVANYILNTTLKEELEKLEVLKLSYSRWRARGSGRPTKKERRDIDDFDEDFSGKISTWDDWEDWEEDLNS
jgi:ribosome-associated heat shock protein Hsp15